MLFLANMREGNEANPQLAERQYLEHFDTIAAGLEMTGNGHIDMSSVISRLKQVHSEKAPIIEAARSSIEALVVSHAHFPFPSEPTYLTRDSIFQAIILLGDNCVDYWGQRTARGDNDTIRIRPESRSLGFMFSALALPPNGITTRDDITDVVCRLNYPMICFKGEHHRKIVRDLEPLAERLQPEEDAPMPESIPALALRPLVALVAAFSGPLGESISDANLEDREFVTIRQFVRWAKRVCNASDASPSREADST